MKKLLVSAAIFVATALVGLSSVGVMAADDGYSPLFNTATNVNGIGDEKDFLRVQNDDGTRVNTKEVCSGETRLWIYVHNNRPSANNNDPNKAGEWDGVAVAHDTRVKLSLPNTFTNSTTATANVSASNAVNSPSDTATITCGSKKVKVEFVAVEAVNSNPQGDYTLSGDIMSANGASLSYKGMTGVVPGCWEYRASIVVKVKVVEEPPKPVPQTLVCTTMNTPIVTDRAKRTVSVSLNAGTATGGASISGYRIDWGDGTTTNAQNGTHSYTSDGTKNITGYVVGTLDGKATSVTSAGCKKSVEFKPETVKALFCDGVTIEKLGGRTVRATAKASASGGATISKYSFNFNGEKTTEVNTSASTASSEYTFASDGDKKIVVTISGTAPNATCEGVVSFSTAVTPPTEKPTTLPSTGAEGMLALFIGTSIAGGLGYRAWAIRRFGR